MVKILTFLQGVRAILSPMQNSTPNQRLGTVMTVVCAILSVAILFGQIWGQGCNAPVDPIEDKDATITDVITDGVGLVVSAVIPVACSPAQQQTWQRAGTVLGQCLAYLGIEGADSLVHKWEGGEAVDLAEIGWELVPGFLTCAGRAGAVLYSGLIARAGDSVGAAMAPSARILSALSVYEDPLEAACGPRTGTPECFVVLKSP